MEHTELLSGAPEHNAQKRWRNIVHRMCRLIGTDPEKAEDNKALRLRLGSGEDRNGPVKADANEFLHLPALPGGRTLEIEETSFREQRIDVPGKTEKDASLRPDVAARFFDAMLHEDGKAHRCKEGAKGEGRYVWVERASLQRIEERLQEIEKWEESHGHPLQGAATFCCALQQRLGKEKSAMRVYPSQCLMQPVDQLTVELYLHPKTPQNNNEQDIRKAIESALETASPDRNLPSLHEGISLNIPLPEKRQAFFDALDEKLKLRRPAQEDTQQTTRAFMAPPNTKKPEETPDTEMQDVKKAIATMPKLYM